MPLPHNFPASTTIGISYQEYANDLSQTNYNPAKAASSNAMPHNFPAPTTIGISYQEYANDLSQTNYNSAQGRVEQRHAP